MQVIHPVCCGIDVHAAQLTACLRRVSEDGQSTTELVNCGTTSRELSAFRTWLQEHQCSVVAMESTGVYWKPVYHVLSEAVEVWVATSHEVRQRPGHKTDQRSKWENVEEVPKVLRLLKEDYEKALRDANAHKSTMAAFKNSGADRKFKRPFGAAPAGAPQRPAGAASLAAPPAPPGRRGRPAGAAHRTA